MAAHLRRKYRLTESMVNALINTVIFWPDKERPVVSGGRGTERALIARDLAAGDDDLRTRLNEAGRQVARILLADRHGARGERP